MREKILATVIAALEPKDFVLAFWQGGSAAHGYTDRWSDIDIEVIVEDNSIEATFEIFEAALETLSQISFKYRVPEPTWHGHSQTFYQLADASSFLVIDFAVMKRSSRNDFLEIERHGNPVIAFDKANLVTPMHLNQKEHFDKMQARFEQLKQIYYFLQVFVKKEIERGYLAQAITNYQNYTLAPLVELLGMIYRPERYDFRNLKYFYRDFPAKIVAQVESLYCIADLNDLIKKQQIAEAIFTENLPIVREKLDNWK